jgi:hypothetical protein
LQSIAQRSNHYEAETGLFDFRNEVGDLGDLLLVVPRADEQH